MGRGAERFLSYSAFGVLLMFMLVMRVSPDPISADLRRCRDANVSNGIFPNITHIKQCCPPVERVNAKPVKDYKLPNFKGYDIRPRLAAQCLEDNEKYAQKLWKAYDLMHKLPSDDPRSLEQQWKLHCTYCGGSFIELNSMNSTTTVGIDVHFSWIFLPWHRWYLYFHERILQSLLGDPTFRLTFWNWDNQETVSAPSWQGLKHGKPFPSKGCYKRGIDFPKLFSDPSKSTFDSLRSSDALGQGPSYIPDLQDHIKWATIPNYTRSSNPGTLISNRAAVHLALVTGGNTTEAFMGIPYRNGDLAFPPIVGSGSLEAVIHPAIHSWTGTTPGILVNDGVDMGELWSASRDPVFYAHHSNVDRLWDVWHKLGPNRKDWCDPDFLEAEFQFWDENGDLVRVQAKDALDTKKMGFYYEDVNDNDWIQFNETKCNPDSYQQVLQEAQKLPTPVPKSGFYLLSAGVPSVFIVDQPSQTQDADEETLVIWGIKLDGRKNSGFDVYLNLLDPMTVSNPGSCAEYGGKFSIMKRLGMGNQIGSRLYKFQSTVKAKLNELQSGPQVVVTLVPYTSEEIWIQGIKIV